MLLMLSTANELDAQVTQTIIGVTTYDLQSNSSLQNRIVNHGNGTLSAVWTYSESYDIVAADRGTGYNFYDGVAWGTQPTARIEAEKTGWPNIARTTGGQEVILSHNSALTVLTQGTRGTIGSGPWALSNVTTTSQVWNRMAVGGANGQTIHHVSAFDPFGGPWTNGVQGQLLYWRSQDGGATYDIQEAVIPGLDQTNYNTFAGDTYHLAAKGDTVVVVYFGSLSPTIMAKSTDNGTTWTSTTLINEFPSGVNYDAGSANITGSIIGISDINGDAIADTVTGTDGSGWVLLDQNGMAHIFYGNMRYLDDTPGDSQWSYFPATNGLMYWNESLGDGPSLMIGASLDLDNSGTLDIIGIAQYFQALSTFPSAGIAANGCIYVSYSAVMENMDQGTQNYRHIYITRSCDGGCTWTNPKDVTPGTGFEENVYGSMARLVDSDIHIVFQKDLEPGIAVNGDNDPYVLNDIIYLKIPSIDYDTVSTGVCYTNISGDTMFCSGGSVQLAASCGTSWLWSTGETTQSINYNGPFGTVTVDIATACGTIQVTKNISAPSTAPVLSVTSTLSEICPGDTSQLTVTSNAGGNIVWSTGETTSTISVLTSGTYSVTVSNCGGSTISSITITTPGPPTAVITASSTTMCAGDSVTLSASPVSQGSYLWSTGATAASVIVNSAGTYSVTVTNCGGSDVSSISISTAPPPIASITGNAQFCNGDSITLTAGSQPSTTYLWSTGETTQSISVSIETTITLTVTNCGGSDNTSVTTSFFAAPAVTVVSGTLAFCEDIGNSSVTISAFAFGAGPFTYLWSSGDSAQFLTLDAVAESGVYIVTATDVCGLTVAGPPDTVEIYPTPVADTVSVVNCSAFGLGDGAIFAAVTGGTAPFAYLWNDANSQTTINATNLFSGTYTLMVTDDNGCTAAVTAFVDQPPPCGTVSTMGVDPTGCGSADGSATATTSGGTAPFTYNWSNGGNTATISGLASGTYSVTVTDANSCTATSSVSLSSGGGPIVFASGTNPSTCGTSDGSATSTVVGGTPPYTYSWSSGGSGTTESNLAAGIYIITVTDANGCVDTSMVTLSSPGAPTLSTTTTDASCTSINGTASVFAAGGTSPYTYQWDDPANQNTSIATGLASGNYNVTVTDNVGCMAFINAFVGSSGIVPTVSFISTDPTCFGGTDGSAAASVSGATSPYSYLWSTGATAAIITNLPAGTYNLQVTDNNGCATNGNVTISEPAEIITIHTTVDPSCGNSDGIASLSTSGGSTPYAYQWDNAAGNQTSQVATGLAAGSYLVTVTDGVGCTEIVTVGLSNNGAPALSVVASDVTCNGGSNGSVTTSVSGGTPPLNYSWSNGSNSSNISGLIAGLYTLTITDAAGCITVENVTITEPDLVVLDISYLNTTGAACDGQANATVTGGTLPYSYTWDDPGNQTSSIATGLCIGSYTVIITDGNGCTELGIISVDSIPMGIGIIEEEPGFSVFPNPSTGTFTVKFEDGTMEAEYIEVVNLLGQRVHIEQVQGKILTYEIRMEKDGKGVYFLNISTEKGILTEKIILY